MRKGQSVEGGVATQSAMRYANEKADEVLAESQYAGLRDRIVTLFTEDKLTSAEIARDVLDDLQLRAGVKISTASSIVRRILQKLVDDDTRAEVHSVLHAKALDRRRDEIEKSRTRARRKLGHCIWGEKYDEYFLELVAREDMRNGQFSDHASIAREMRKRFRRSFTPDDSRRHLEQLRRKGLVPHSTVPRKRKPRGADDMLQLPPAEPDTVLAEADLEAMTA